MIVVDVVVVIVVFIVVNNVVVTARYMLERWTEGGGAWTEGGGADQVSPVGRSRTGPTG